LNSSKIEVFEAIVENSPHVPLCSRDEHKDRSWESSILKYLLSKRREQKVASQQDEGQRCDIFEEDNKRKQSLEEFSLMDG
jgi:hypothetical protein